MAPTWDDIGKIKFAVQVWEERIGDWRIVINQRKCRMFRSSRRIGWSTLRTYDGFGSFISRREALRVGREWAMKWQGEANRALGPWEPAEQPPFR